MAVYFLRARHISRGKGGRVTRAAAYRAGERILDLRTSETHDFSDRRDIPYKEVVLPANLTGRPDMAWTQDRSTLWNAAEHAGLRRNSRLAREWLVFIPAELTPAQRAQLVRTFASELAEKYRCAVDACIHEPRPGADPRNHHAHLLMTTREVIVRERQKVELKRDAAEYFARRKAEPKRIRWNQLTREERNAHRRKQYEARRAVEKSDPALEAKRRESRRLEVQRRQQNNPESIRAARRRWFHAHADEINRKQREYRQAHADEINRKRREYRQARAERSQSKSSESTAEQSAKNWLKHLERHGPGPSAEQSAKNWLASLESHGLGPTAEESARAWLDYLEREASADRSPSTPASADEHGRARSSDGVQPDSPDRDHDYGL